MTTYVVLLRAANLGPRNKVSMAGWRASLAALGYECVRTHLTSGNAVVRTRRSEPTVVREVTASLLADLGLEVAVLVRPLDELDDLVRVGASYVEATAPGHAVVVSFLSAVPEPAAVAALDVASYLPEELLVHGRTVLHRYPEPPVRVRLGSALYERHFGGRATSRTWGSVCGLHRVAHGDC